MSNEFVFHLIDKQLDFLTACGSFGLIDTDSLIAAGEDFRAAFTAGEEL